MTDTEPRRMRADEEADTTPLHRVRCLVHSSTFSDFLLFSIQFGSKFGSKLAKQQQKSPSFEGLND